MNREHRSWKLICMAAALTITPVAVRAADDQPPGSSDQTVQQQMNEMTQDMAAMKKQIQNQQTEIQDQQEEISAQHQQIAQQQDQQSATTQTAVAAAQSAAKAAVVEAMADESIQSTNNISQAVTTMFEPPTGENYMSPFSIQNPANMRPDMNMQIGQLGDMQFYMGLQTVGRFQAITQQGAYFDNATHHPVEYPGLNPGFQTAYGNLDFLATIPGKLDVFFDLYLSSVGHPSTTYGDQGYIILKQLPPPFADGALGALFDYINVKAGAFDIDFGDANYHRTNNAYTFRNPLIGNELVDTDAEQIGAEVYSVKGPVYWLAGVGNGTTDEYFDYGSEPSVHGKIWGYPTPDLRLSASAYYCNLANTANAAAGGANNQITDLYASTRSGEPYNAIFNAGDDAGNITPMAGLDVQAYQGDLTWNCWPWELYGNVGWTQDSAYDERWLYGAGMATYHITSALYLAAQYSYAIAGAVNGVDSSGWVERFQVGGGYWLTKSLLCKLEYVYDQYNNFSPSAGTVSGVIASDNPRFSGLTAEVSFGF
jgi:hypothetical protein